MILKNIIYDMRRQPVVAILSTLGTALSIFLIMIVVIMQQVDEADISPEINRHRSLRAKYINIDNNKGSQSSNSFSLNAINELYQNLDNVEYVGISDMGKESEVSIPGKAPVMSVCKQVNSDFFKIYEYDFINGAPFTSTDVESQQKAAIITESVARDIFADTDVVGREVLIDHRLYRIAGVIRDVNPIVQTARAELFIPIPSLNEEYSRVSVYSSPPEKYLGPYEVTLLVKDPKHFQSVKTQVANRYAVANKKMEKDGWQITYFGAPFTHRESQGEKYSNCPPDTTSERNFRIGLIALLLLVPAINLSSITQNRLRQRVSETGLKRAFGCTKTRIALDMFLENLIHTALGAVIGLALSIITAMLFADFLFLHLDFSDIVNTKASFNPLTMLSWSTFGWAAFFCLLLNILSSGIPVFMASRVNPAEAINGHSN